MATITASLERSLQNCSLNQSGGRNRRSGGGGGGGGGDGVGRSSSSDSPEVHNRTTQSNASSSDDNSTFIELNSHVSLPYHWEQCLDLKTGEIYYINWSTGMKAKEDPRTTAAGYNGDYYSEEEDEDEDDDEEESNCYDDSDEGSSTESSLSSSTTTTHENNFRSRKKLVGKSGSRINQQLISQDSVLVVAGCKSCLMYHMVPKHVEDCPKCSGQLFHFPTNNPPPNHNSS